MSVALPLVEHFARGLDFWELSDYAVARHVGVKFSTNGVFATAIRAMENLASAGFRFFKLPVVCLRSGIDSALLGLGRAAAGELERDDIVVPPGFMRRLGAPAG